MVLHYQREASMFQLLNERFSHNSNLIGMSRKNSFSQSLVAKQQSLYVYFHFFLGIIILKIPRNYKVIKRLLLIYINLLIITKITPSPNQSTTESLLSKELQFRVFQLSAVELLCFEYIIIIGKMYKIVLPGPLT